MCGHFMYVHLGIVLKGGLLSGKCKVRTREGKRTRIMMLSPSAWVLRRVCSVKRMSLRQTYSQTSNRPPKHEPFK